MNIVILQSCASGKSVRINMTGQVEGVGGNGYHAQFRVHVRRPGVVALQNVHNSQNWIAIHQGRTIGTVREIASIFRASTKKRAQGKPLLTSILSDVGVTHSMYLRLTPPQSLFHPVTISLVIQ